MTTGSRRRRSILALVGAVLLASGGAAQPRATAGRPGFANPTALVHATMALSRATAEDGQWTAMREAAREDAVLFTPRPVNARRWLKRQAETVRAARWSAAAVYMACDGGSGLVRGKVVREGAGAAAFAAIWRRSDKRSFEWLLYGEMPLPADDAPLDNRIQGHVADCPRAAARSYDRKRAEGEERSRDESLIADPPPASGTGGSNDGTLRWAWAAESDGGWHLTVNALMDGTDKTIIDDRIMPPGA